MKSFKVLVVAALGLIITGSAMAIPDHKLTCEQLEEEIAAQGKIISDNQGKIAGSKVAEVGAGSAVNAGIWGGLGKGLGALGHAANAVGGIAGLSKQNAEQAIKNAEMRTSSLNGIYLGKGCMDSAS